MKTLIPFVIFWIFSHFITSAQEKATPDPIDVDVPYNGGDKHGNGAGNSGGSAGSGNSGNKKSPSKDKPGRNSISSPVTKFVLDLINSYYGSFKHMCFPIGLIPGTKTQLQDQVKDEMGKAAIEGRTADEKLLKDFLNDLNKTSGNFYNITGNVLRKVTINLQKPTITLNQLVNYPTGQFNGIAIYTPLSVYNANLSQIDLVIRFFDENNNEIIANAKEGIYKNQFGNVVAGKTFYAVPEKFSINPYGDLLKIPYFAFNYPPSNGKTKRQVRAQAVLYINNYEAAKSALVPFNFNF